MLTAQLDIELVVAVDEGRLAGVAAERGFADGPRLGVADRNVMVFLGMHRDLLGALLVLEIPLIVAAAALGRIGLQSRDRLLRRQVIGQLVLVVIDGADDQGPVRIAFQKFDDYFLSDARNDLTAPFLAGPDLSNAQPARPLFLPVPKKSYIDFAEVFDVDLLARIVVLGHHLGGLDTINPWLRRQHRRPERTVARQELVAPEIDVLTGVAGTTRAVRFDRERMGGSYHQIFDVLRVLVMLLEFSQSTGEQVDCITVAAAPPVHGLLGLKLDLRVTLAVGFFLELPRIVVKFHF